MVPGGEKLALGVRGNPNILRLDVRLTDITLDLEYAIGRRLGKNRNRVHNQYYLIDRDDVYPNEKESGLLEEPEEPEWTDEEEDEMEKLEVEEAGKKEESGEMVVVKSPGEIKLSKTTL